ncbi:hypothetical protein ACWEOR_06045 [Micromonospora chalcea]
MCRDTYPDRPIGVAGLRFAGQSQVFHVYATWAGWAFDHAGWNREAHLLAITACRTSTRVIRSPAPATT